MWSSKVMWPVAYRPRYASCHLALQGDLVSRAGFSELTVIARRRSVWARATYLKHCVADGVREDLIERDR